MTDLTMSDSNHGGLSLPTRMHRAARRLTDRLGVHGYGLLLIAGVWVLVGAGVLVDSHTPPGTIHGMIPAPVRLVMWWGAALLALNAAIDREGPRRDGFALAAVVVAPTIRLVSHLWAWIASFLPGDPPPHPLGWLNASIYLALIGLVVLVAAIPDTPREQT